MAGLRIHIVMPSELVERVDAALVGEESRGEFVRRAVEQALSEAQGPVNAIQADPGSVPSDRRGLPPEGVRSAAPAEQPYVEEDAREMALQREAEQGRARMLEDLADGDARVRSSRGARAVSQPGPDVSRHRASDQVQRSGPIVKGGKK